ncbi:MAG: pyrroline-5-carboxylate reductase [Bacillota bacterium]|nr:pyrroline-5-carboxylate reductase [Bacillota bacterium]
MSALDSGANREDRESICFIGAGALAWSLVNGMLKRGGVNPEQLRVCNKADDCRLDRFARLGVQTSRDKSPLIAGAKTVVLAVKPQDAGEALQQAAPWLEPGSLLVSAVAGLPLSYIAAAVGDKVHLVRAMPNTSSQVGLSATAIAAARETPRELVLRACRLFEAVGAVFEVDESLLDAVTAVSGSGPAYFYFFTELLIGAAEKAGLDPELARQLAVQTLRGAAAMLGEPGADPARLRAQVTSPRGTTEAAIKAMTEHRLPNAVAQGVLSAADRSRELGAGFRTGDR